MGVLNETTNPGAWGPKEKEEWFARQTIQRSYDQDVVSRLKALPSDALKLEQYGALSCNPKRYPLYCVRSAEWNDANPTVLITGGVHGYEPSGIMGALRFLEEVAPQYAGKVNFVVYPCVSPLAYEINHRWNRKAEDPNRHFTPGTTVEESAKLMKSVESLGKHFKVAVDLHETNKRDIELTMERHARDGDTASPEDFIIPEGFYLCVPKQDDVALGHKIVEAVSKVTPICKDKKILGYPSDNGIIVLDDVPGLCQGFTRRIADVSMTTEIYPDKAPAREAQDAQLATVKRAIAFALKP